MKQVVIALLLLSLCSCWRMPQEGEVSTLPNTNNPSVVPQNAQPWMPVDQ